MEPSLLLPGTEDTEATFIPDMTAASTAEMIRWTADTSWQRRYHNNADLNNLLKMKVTRVYA